MELRRYDGIMKEWENMLPDSSYCGYMGMYYCNHKWYGDWFQIAENTFSETDHANLASLCLEIAKLWPDGCDWNMSRAIEQFEADIKGNTDHHLLETGNEVFRYLLFINLDYENFNYPIRIQTYRK